MLIFLIFLKNSQSLLLFVCILHMLISRNFYYFAPRLIKKTDVLRRGPKPDPACASISHVLWPVSLELRVKNTGLNNWCPCWLQLSIQSATTQEHMFAHKILINFTDWDKNILVLSSTFMLSGQIGIWPIQIYFCTLRAQECYFCVSLFFSFSGYRLVGFPCQRLCYDWPAAYVQAGF